jgi:hypothetical protein
MFIRYDDCDPVKCQQYSTKKDDEEYIAIDIDRIISPLIDISESHPNDENNEHYNNYQCEPELFV